MNKSHLSARPRRRILVAVGLVLLSGLTTAGIGLYQESKTSSADLPEVFGLPEPRVGDRGRYESFVVTVEENGTTTVNPHYGAAMSDRPFSFEWLTPTTVRDFQGLLQRVNQLQVTFDYDQKDENSQSSISFVYYFEAASGSYLGYTRFLQYGGNISTSILPGLVSSASLRMNINVTAFSEDSSLLFIRCGALNILQGRRVDPRDPFHLCPSDGRSFQAESLERLGKWTALRFDQKSRWLQNPSSHLWFVETVPYAVQVAMHRHVFRLVQFEAGSRPLANDASTPSQSSPFHVESAPRLAWGPDDADVDHPFPLSKAFAYARDDPKAPRVRQFLGDHPEAYVSAADYSERENRTETGTYVTRHHWDMVLTDGEERLPVGISQEIRPQTPLRPLPIGAPDIVPRQTIYRYANASAELLSRNQAMVPAPAQLPGNLPTIRSLFETWEVYAGTAHENEGSNAWSFTWVCRVEGSRCENPRMHIYAGRVRSIFTHGSLGAPTSPAVLEGEFSTLEFDQEGNLLSMREGAGGQSHAIAPALGFLSVGGAADFSLASLATDALWKIPLGTAFLATLVAAIVGLLYGAWPWLKKAIFLHLFSRVESSNALDHSGRAHLASLIEANPGIHLQEINRRTGWGMGTTRHHVQKLVETGLVVEQVSEGYTCYFAKGAIDRRLMAAAPVLKSEGSHKVLVAATKAPGASCLQLAQQTGLTSATVNYHLKRLSQAGLLLVERAGREVRITPTDLGRSCVT